VRRLPYLLLSIVMWSSSSLAVEIRAQAPADTALYAVSYLEVMPSARAAADAAIKRYRDTSRQENGYVRVELLEQVAWPGHFAIIDKKPEGSQGLNAGCRARGSFVTFVVVVGPSCLSWFEALSSLRALRALRSMSSALRILWTNP